MSKAGVNEVLAVIARRKAGQPLTVREICVALDPQAPNAYGSPFWRAVHKSLDHLGRRGFTEVSRERKAAPAPSFYGASASGRAFHAENKPIVRGPAAGVEKTKPSLFPNPFHDRLWIALRVKKRGTLPELLQAASRDEDGKNVEGRARSFLNSLERAQIVIAQGKKNRRVRARGEASGSRLITYILSNDLGPKTPKPQRDYVFDQNTRERIAYADKKENYGE
jgi:hypothetical protein